MIKYSDLHPCSNLKQIFREINDYIYTNTAIARKERQGAELLRIIFCKMMDEELSQCAIPNSFCAFQYFAADNDKSFMARICLLYEKTKNKYSEDFDQNETIQLDVKTLKFIVKNWKKLI